MTARPSEQRATGVIAKDIVDKLEHGDFEHRAWLHMHAEPIITAALDAERRHARTLIGSQPDEMDGDERASPMPSQVAQPVSEEDQRLFAEAYVKSLSEEQQGSHLDYALDGFHTGFRKALSMQSGGK